MTPKYMRYAVSPLVRAYADVIDSCLDKAKAVKPQASIEPALTFLDLKEQIQDLGRIRGHRKDETKQPHYAAIETAFRNSFYELLVSDYCHSIPVGLTHVLDFINDRPVFLQRYL